MELKNKVVVVTGGGRGIGKALGLALGTCGAHVVLAARSTPEIEEVARLICAGGGAATAIAADLTREQDVLALFQQVEQSLGRLDVLINNAGIGIFGAVAEFNVDDFDRVINTNLRGTFLCCREAMKRMIPQRSGYIINMASVVGFKGYARQAAYTASKHGVVGLTKSLAVEAQPHGIRVSVVLPGGVDTGMVGDARPDLDPSVLLRPQDVVQGVLYLLSLSEKAAVDEIYIRRRASAPF